MSAGRRVVITGLGVASPIGIGADPFWNALIDGRVGIDRIAAFDASGLASHIGGELPPFQLGDCIPKGYRKSSKVVSRDIIISVLCAYHAARDAGLKTRCLIERGDVEPPTNVDPARFGANIGAGLISADLPELASALITAADEQGAFSLSRWGTEGMNNLTPLWLLKFLPNMLACHVTIVHDAQAPSNTITCGEASSHLAIGEAFRCIARGDADVCFCGGAESRINPMSAARQFLLGRLNVTDDSTPKTACRPFCEDARGSVISEGGGLVILEALEHAQARNARIYAELVGFAASGNSHSWSSPDPTGRPTALAVGRALADAGVAPRDVQLVAPFGVGIPAIDSAELCGYQKIFTTRLSEIPAITTQGTVGNNGAGSGALEIAAAVMAVQRGIVPPSVNAPPWQHNGFRFILENPIDAPNSCAVTSASSINGSQHAALVLRRYGDNRS